AAQRSSCGEQQPDGRAAETRGSGWSTTIKPDGTLEVSHKGAPIITTMFLFWNKEGNKWIWADPSLKFEPDGPGQWSASGQVTGLKLKMAGWVRSTAPHAIQIDLLIRAEQEMPDVIGGGFQWNLKLDSPSFQGRVAAPELLPESKGWTWR